MDSESQQGSETEIMGVLPRGGRLPTEAWRSNEALVFACSHLIAAQADHVDILIRSGEPGPRHFRAEVLADFPGHLLAPDHVESWIEEQGTKDGSPSWWITAELAVPSEQSEEQADGTVLIRELRVSPFEEIDGKPVLGHKYLLYSTPNHAEWKCPVRNGGKLDQVRRYSEDLSKTYPWTPPQATMFVLARLVPVLDPRLLMQPQNTPTIDLQVRGRRAREMSLKHLQLGVFAAWHLGEPLTVRMAEWNTEYPEWAYELSSNFSWDSAQAMRRLSERAKAYLGHRKETQG